MKKSLISLLCPTIVFGTVTPIAINISNKIETQTTFNSNQNEFDTYSKILNKESRVNNLELTNPSNLNYLIFQDLKNYKIVDPIFNGTKIAFQQWEEIRQQSGYGSQNLNGSSHLVSKTIKKNGELNLSLNAISPIDGENVNSFCYDWDNLNLNIYGAYVLDSYTTQYDSIYNYRGGNGWGDQYDNIVVHNTTIPEVKLNYFFNQNKNDVATIDENNYQTFEKFKYWIPSKNNYLDLIIQLSKTWEELSGQIWSNDSSWTGSNAYCVVKKSSNFGWTYGAGNQFNLFSQCWKRGIKMWSSIAMKEYDQENINDSIKRLQAKAFNDLEVFEKTNIGAINFHQDIFNILFSSSGDSRDGINLGKLIYDDHGNIWSGVTINKNTKFCLNFSRFFWWIKTLDFCNDVIEYLNNEIILKNQDFPININLIPLNDFHAMKSLISQLQSQNWKNNGLKESIALFLQQLFELKFKNLDEIESYLKTLIKTNNFTGFKGNEGRFDDCYQNLKSKIQINSFSFDSWNKLYDAILNLLKSYNICFNASIYQNRKRIPLMEIDENGNETSLKSFKLWDGEKGEFNWDFINDIGKNNIDYNILEFSIDKIFLEPTNLKSNINNVSVDNLNNIQINIGKNPKEHIFLAYRFNAVPIDRIILNEMYDPKYATYFNLKSDKYINQVVYLKDESQEVINSDGSKEIINHSINDLIVSDKYNIRKIILKSLNESIMGFVINADGYGKNYPIFSDIVCGIGVNDLNKYFNFNQKECFFDLASWRTALNKFQIKYDHKNKRYPLFASTISNNIVYVIGTINNWYFQDGTHGDFEGCWKEIVSNKFRWDRSDINNPKLAPFNGLQEIKPISRIKADGSWDNKGYFLIKLNIGDAYGTWMPNITQNQYMITNWDEIMNQLINPINMENQFPYKNAGITQFMSAMDNNNNPIFWENKKFQVTEETFFEKETYWLDDWKLNVDKIYDELELNNNSNPAKKWLYNAIKKWIANSNKLSPYDQNKLLTKLSTVQGEKDLIKQTLNWYINNCMINVEFENYWFRGIEVLKSDILFNQLINFYGYSFDDLFTQQLIYIQNESTGIYRLVPNSDYNFSLDNWNMNLKVIKNDDNNLVFSNKNQNITNEKAKANIRIPVLMIRELISKKIFYPPEYFLDSRINPYQANKLINQNPHYAIEFIYGLSIRLPKINYENDTVWTSKPKLIKQNLKTEKKVINIVIVSLAPIVALLLIGSICIGYSVLIKKIKRKK